MTTTQINWIRCSEQMPPDDHSEIILNDGNNNWIFEGYMIHIEWMKKVAINHKWIPYTEEAWNEVSK